MTDLESPRNFRSQRCFPDQIWYFCRLRVTSSFVLQSYSIGGASTTKVKTSTWRWPFFRLFECWLLRKVFGCRGNRLNVPQTTFYDAFHVKKTQFQIWSLRNSFNDKFPQHLFLLQCPQVMSQKSHTLLALCKYCICASIVLDFWVHFLHMDVSSQTLISKIAFHHTISHVHYLTLKATCMQKFVKKSRAVNAKKIKNRWSARDGQFCREGWIDAPLLFPGSCWRFRAPWKQTTWKSKCISSLTDFFHLLNSS